MPIYDQTYRRYAGSRQSPGSAWAVIALTGLRSLIRKKFFLAVMLFSWAQFVVRAVLLYLAANFPQMDLLAPTPETFREFFEQQGFFVFVVTVYVGAGLISTDRRVHALQIYLSKPLTRVEYIAGKLAILVALLLAVTWINQPVRRWFQFLDSTRCACSRGTPYAACIPDRAVWHARSSHAPGDPGRPAVTIGVVLLVTLPLLAEQLPLGLREQAEQGDAVA